MFAVFVLQVKYSLLELQCTHHYITCVVMQTLHSRNITASHIEEVELIFDPTSD